VGLTLAILVGATALATAAGGRLGRLADRPILAGRLVVVAVAAQVIGALLTRATGQGAWYIAGLALSAVAALAVCLRNRRLAGLGLVATGLVANAIVVGLNAAMPVSATAAARAGVPVATIAAGDDPRHELAGPSTRLRGLGDVVPVPLPWRPEVVSPGDVLIIAGLAEFVFLGMRPRRITLDPVRRQRRPAVTLSPPRRRSCDGEEESQAQGPGKEQGQPRQASELLSGLSRTPPRT
jgi:hypothetical protein